MKLSSPSSLETRQRVPQQEDNALTDGENDAYLSLEPVVSRLGGNRDAVRLQIYYPWSGFLPISGCVGAGNCAAY
jgi:hypothetical protein